MKVVFFDYSVIFFCLFFTIGFIALTIHVMNLVVGLMVFSLLVAGLFLRFSYEYLAFAYLIIYFGAVIMLFVFIVMMLDINNVYEPLEWRGNLKNLFLICLCGKFGILFFEFSQDRNNLIDSDFSFNYYLDWNSSFATIDAFIAFFNFYWIWLIIIGLLMLSIVIGLVHGLMDCYGEIIELYEAHKGNKKKLIFEN